jgi:rubrerythrin
MLKQLLQKLKAKHLPDDNPKDITIEDRVFKYAGTNQSETVSCICLKCKKMFQVEKPTANCPKCNHTRIEYYIKYSFEQVFTPKN